MHTPVLLQQAIESLNIKKGKTYIDATFGEGGYSQAISEKGGRILGIDRDKNQIFNLKFSIFNLKLIQGNFADIEKIAKENDFFPVDGVVFDLGLSMKQINESNRGFSFKKLNEPLDMRLSLDNQVTAADLLNKSSEVELYDIFARNSEEVNSKIIAKQIFYTRRLGNLNIVGDLIKVINQALKRIDAKTYARIFQALRIEVNDEFENLKQGLEGAVKILKKEGRIVVVSFHSLEDRIVKNFVKNNQLKFLEKKPITNKFGPSYERSAKLRTIVL